MWKRNYERDPITVVSSEVTCIRIEYGAQRSVSVINKEERKIFRAVGGLGAGPILCSGYENDVTNPR